MSQKGEKSAHPEDDGKETEPPAQKETNEKETPVEKETPLEGYSLENVGATGDSTKPKRIPKPTPKGLQAQIDDFMKRRKSKMKALTRLRNNMEELMIDYKNEAKIKEDIAVFNSLSEDILKLHQSVQTTLPKEERDDDQHYWRLPLLALRQFQEIVSNWLDKATFLSQQPDGGASEVLLLGGGGSQKARSSIKSTASSSSSSMKRKAEAKKAALMVRAANLKKKQELEQKERDLKYEFENRQAILKSQQEEMDIQNEIGAETAIIQTLSTYDNEQNLDEEQLDDDDVDDVKDDDGHDDDDDDDGDDEDGQVDDDDDDAEVEQSVAHQQTSNRLSGRRAAPGGGSRQVQHRATPRLSSSKQAQSHTTGPGNNVLATIMKRQNKITEMLIKEQRHTLLPSREVPVFRGDPLQYLTFIRVFEHTVEEKTDSFKDRLFFLEQYTEGHAKELVRSCRYADHEKGYLEAKRLLQENFGNELLIASACVDKISKWNVIKGEDKKLLHAYAVTLRACLNTMQDIKFLDELNTPSQIREVVLKLPYRLREKWRTRAFDFYEHKKRRAKFPELVSFIERQARMAMDPLYGDIQDPAAKRDQRGSKPFSGKVSHLDLKKSSFATVASPAVGVKQEVNTTSRPCVFCAGEHSDESCKINKRPHKEKIECLKGKGICFGCLVKGHRSKDCRNRLKCDVCSQSHPTVLHIHKEKNEEKADGQGTSKTVSSGMVALEVHGVTGAGTGQTLSIVPVQIKMANSTQVLQTYALLDSGSNACFCTRNLLQQLKAKPIRTRIMLNTMGQKKAVNTSFVPAGCLEVSGIDGQDFYGLPKLYTEDKLPVRNEHIPRQAAIEKWTYLNEVKLEEIDGTVELLIGTNAPRLMEPQKIINSQHDGPYAVQTVLGWVVNGFMEVDDSSAAQTDLDVTTNRISVTDLSEMLMQQYNFDFPERKFDERKEMSVEDKRFMKTMSDSATKKDGHYQLALPFKEKELKMPNNRNMAEQRATSLKRKCCRNTAFHEEYRTFLEDVIRKGHAELVPQEELEAKTGKVWYIPHHGVRHPRKGTIRVVFDCSASFQGTSLNDNLIQGPNLTNTLLGVLMRFRQEPVAFMADVEGMFHQVQVAPSDRDYLRFLWWPGGDLTQPLVEFRMTVHLFGATSSSSCASYALTRSAEDNQDSFSAEAVNTVQNNFYVDDCLKSVPTDKDAVALYEELKDLCGRGGFNLTKWISNSRTVLSSIPEADRAKEVKTLDLEKQALPVERALGIEWSVEEDVFRFKVCLKPKPETRRGILSTVSSVYDPLGFLSPFVFTAKHILQQLCKLSGGWDEEIPEALRKPWQRWLMGLKQMEEFSITRCIKPVHFGQIQSAQMHFFCDASDIGYGVAAYLRILNEKGDVHTALVLGKARVAPLKPITVPRMELTAAVLAVRLEKMASAEMRIPLKDSIFWTDSTAVIKYIRNENQRFQTFVANRVGVIREATQVSQWRYVNTKLNTADHASRGLNAEAFLKCTAWCNGPDFLKRPEEEWPKYPDELTSSTPDESDDPEIKREKVVVNACTGQEEDPTSELMHHFSDLRKLKCATAWFLRLKDVLLQLSRRRKEVSTVVHTQEKDVEKWTQMIEAEMKRVKRTMTAHTLTSVDLEKAEEAIVRYCQQQCFAEELRTLKVGGCVKRTSPLHKLDPVLEKSVLRVGGRLNKMALPEEVRNPVILPKGHHISTLILRTIHQKIGHGGRNHILSMLRQKYWLPCANALARKIISECTVCRRLHAVVGEQKMADLPKDRVTPDLPPFTHVGVDYFGPIEVKRGRTILKRYGVIFTCLTSRAIHLEVAQSMDTDSCINAFRRFISRRGQVQEIRSDNGTNFIAAEKELKEALKEWNLRKIDHALQQKNVKWTFNPPYGAHFGGVWERLIRLVKKTLLSVTRQQHLDDEGLVTVMCEVEAILNSRPLTTVSDEPNDLEALTPNHLLQLKVKPVLPPGIFYPHDIYARRRWRQIQYVSDLFWTRWVKEYLPLLQERQRWNRTRRNFMKGDIVLIVDFNAPRGSWLMARVLETRPGSRGLVRSVLLKTRTNELERPISKLCLLVPASE